MGRKMFALRVGAVGEEVNKLRLLAVDNKWFFVAGILRGAEEILLITYNMLNDENTPEGEL